MIVDRYIFPIGIILTACEVDTFSWNWFVGGGANEETLRIDHVDEAIQLGDGFAWTLIASIGFN